eukprot:917913-Alexandrium_andersonii.AAC.1
MKGHPCYFRNPETGMEIVAHVDDGLVAYDDEGQFEALVAALGEHISLKVTGHVTEAGWTKYLGKYYRKCDKGFE